MNKEIIKQINIEALHPSDFKKPFSKEGKDGKEGKDDICGVIDQGVWS